MKVRGAFASLLDAELFELSGLSALCAAVPCGVPPSRESTRCMDAWMCPCGVHSFLGFKGFVNPFKKSDLLEGDANDIIIFLGDYDDDIT